MPLKFMSSVLFVKDIQASRHFYENILNQKVDIDFNLCVGYVGGFSIWQAEHALQTIFGSSVEAKTPLGLKNCELGFESEDLDELVIRVTQEDVRFVHPIIEQPWGQRVFRIYDPDGHMIEIGEPMTAVIRRLLTGGNTVEFVAQRTAMPLDIVRAIASGQPT